MFHFLAEILIKFYDRRKVKAQRGNINFGFTQRLQGQHKIIFVINYNPNSEFPCLKHTLFFLFYAM